MPKIYTDEFKQSALELLGEGMTQKQVCADPQQSPGKKYLGAATLGANWELQRRKLIG
ncbi:hypothetical protein [Burkholderia multivorans]|uniref:hypothetical protein n=1 Tax=Burkholderia multivorans TaxID=87883 RepID=UPI0015EB59DB